MTSDSSNKNILITGASGLIGSALQEYLTGAGYRVFALERHGGNGPFVFDQDNERMDLDASIPLAAVINLAGAGIADGRWTEKRKQEIWDSRIRTTTLLCEALAQLPHKPEVLISASAIGFYGKQCRQPADEESPAGDDFLANLSVAWEQAADAATQSGIRTVKLRFGLVLSDKGGVLENLVLPLKLAVVGRLGDGTHLQSWIGLADALSIISGCIENRNFSGPLNAVAPEVVTNREFARSLSKALSRPQLPPLPAAVVRVMFGEMADAALLASANINSKRIAELGVSLQHPALGEALQAIYS